MLLFDKITNNKKIIENFSYLTILQIFSLLSPLITYPYIIKVIGLEKYGIVIFAQTIVTYFSLIINFGFNISGPKDVAVYRDDIKMLSEYVSSIYIIKSIIWIVCFIVFIIGISSFDFLRENLIIYVFAFFATISDVFFPIWFFQGIEKMKYITYINLFVRSLFIFAIFFFIKQKSDYIIVPLINSIGAFLSGIIALYVVFGKEGIKFKYISLEFLIIRLKEGFVLFISTLSIQLYMNVNKIIVGTLLGMKEVTIYDLGEKITSLIKTPILIIGQSVFPKISREKSIVFINKIMFLVTSIAIALYILLFFTSDWIVFFFTATIIPMAKIVIRILGLSLIFVSLSLFLGGNRLVPFGYNKEYMVAMISNSVVYFILVGILWIFHLINIYTITISYVFIEAFCFVLLYFINKKLQLLRSR